MKHLLTWVFTFATALCATLHAALIADLDAIALPHGEITEVQEKTISAHWRANEPLRVENVLGRSALIFNGRQELEAEFALPTRMQKGPFTVEVWVCNPTVEKTETVVGFASVRGGLGTECNFGNSPTDGAFRSSFNATAAFGITPSANQWHHIAWTFGGGSDSTLRVYVDGELDTECALPASLPPLGKMYIGSSGEANPKKNVPNGFSGAIARVCIQDTALTQSAVRKSAGLLTTFAPIPRQRETTETLRVPLAWQPGSPDATAFLVYISTQRAAVERGERSIARAVTAPRFGPMDLQVGATYFWRVDSLDKTGRVIAPGVVWDFTADEGLAGQPHPRNNDSNIAPVPTRLTWQPGKYALRQRLHFGTSAQQVEGATAPAIEVAAGTASLPTPVPLAPGTRYFWRVESYNGTQPPSHGQTWTFRTTDPQISGDVTFFIASDSHYGRENNAALNQRVIKEMNALPGTPLPDSIGGGLVQTPRGVVLNGDLIDDGSNTETTPALWAEFCNDYGLTGGTGRLCFPVYEGFGNHDGGPERSFVRRGIKERNPHRTGLKAISENGLHYSWDWGQVHLVQLNLFGGSSPADVKGVNAKEHNPEGSLDFLKEDLAQNVGTTGRPVVIFQHFGWVGGMSEWWQPEAKERFFEAIKAYNVVCLINGHSHTARFLPWHDILTIHDGSTARGEENTGDFMIVRVTERELTVIQRKLGEWGIAMRKPLGTPASIAKP